MADAPASTPPQQQQQEQPTRPASFEATWDQQDASFLQPGAIPLPKAHRAWERQPQSPFARNGRYRKVWKRYDLRSQPKTKLSAAEMNKKSPAKSPRKVVKKRALDAPLDPNATPGKKGPKNKAFAPTQWETPRRNSGRIASRKIAQPIFIEEPRPITAQTETSTPVTEDDIPKWSRAEGAEKNVSSHNNLEVGAIIEENKDSVETDKQSVPQVENAAEVLHSELAQGQREKTPPPAEISPEVMVVEEDEVSELQESPEQPQTENADPDVDTSPSEVVAGVELNETSEDLVEEHGSVDSNPTESEAVKSCSVVEEDDQAQLAKDISVDPRHFGALSEEQEGSGNMSEQSYGEEVEHREADLESSKSSNSLSGEDEPVDTFEKATLHGFEDSKANQGACMNEDQDPTASEKQPSELPANDLGEKKQVDGVIAQHLTVTEAAEELLDTAMEGGEEQAQAGASATEAVVQESIAPLKEEKPIDAEHRLQADATLVAIPDPTLEKDERSSTSSVSDDGMDEAEQLDEDEYTLTELPEGGEGEVEDDATSIPSPSLSAAESPRFSSVADTLTLNLPDRTPPKNRTTKELPEEPASPIDEDTAFLKDFLSRADASKANREAATSRPESITNRRNSDIMRLALSSPRVALETKDPNFSSTSNANPLDQKAMPKESDSSSTASVTAVMKLDFSDLTSDLTLEKSSTSGSPSPAPQPPTEPPSSKPPQPPTTTARRSARQTRQTRLPATPSAASAGPNRITLLRGAEPIVLKKSQAQELTALTRNNTRRNKGAALAAPIRLNKLKAEALKASAATPAEGKEGEEQVPVYADERIEVWEASRLRWDRQLVYFQEEAEDGLAGLVSLSDEEGVGAEGLGSAAGSRKRKGKSDSGDAGGEAGTAAATPARTKRARGLGAGNGTPAKGLLAPAKSLLPEGVGKGGECDGEKDEERTTEKKNAAAALSAKGGAGRSRKAAAKEVSYAPAPASANSSNTTATPIEQPSSSSSSALPAVPSSVQQKGAAHQLPPPPPSNPPTPSSSSSSSSSSSRRSRLQTPRKVKLPVPVSTAPAAAPSSHQQSAATLPNGIIGSTPRKMGPSTAIGKQPLATTATTTTTASSAGAGAGEERAQGLSGGRRRAAAAGRRA